MLDYDFCQIVEFEFLVGEQINHICYNNYYVHLIFVILFHANC